MRRAELGVRYVRDQPPAAKGERLEQGLFLDERTLDVEQASETLL